MGITDDWNKTLADAKKTLGTSAKIPEAKMQNVLQKVKEGNKLGPAFATARDALEKKIEDLQDAGSKIKNALSLANAELSKNNFGLDPKKPDDKKKIDAAQKAFSQFFQDSGKEIDDIISKTNELDKHMEQLSDYKGPS
jgi:hypothetical protein